MKNLIETLVADAKLIERDSKNLPEGVLCRVTYPICNIGEKNHNNRIYERDVWDKVLANENVVEKINNRTLYGQAEHPEGTVQSNLEKTSHIVNRIWVDKVNEKDEEGNEREVEKALAEFDVLDTPYGRIVNTILLADSKLGCSTRAEGELEECEDESKGKYLRVIPEQYSFRTIDFTADASTHRAYPENIERELVTQVSNGIESKKVDPKFAMCVLEDCKSESAKVLMESIKATDEGKIPNPSQDSEEKVIKDLYENKDFVDFVTKQITDGVEDAKIMEDAKKQFEIDEKIDISSIIKDIREKQTKTDGTVSENKLVFENYLDMVDFLKDEYSKRNEDFVKMFDAAFPDKSSVTRAKVSLAETKADLNKTSELLEKADAELKTVRESYSKDMVALNEKIEEGKKKLKDEHKTVLDLRKQIIGLEESTKKIKTDSDKAIVDEKKKAEDKVKQIKADTDTKIKQMESQHQIDMIEKYAEIKARLSGLTLSPATLEKVKACTTEKDVDNLFNELRDALTEELLHYNRPKGKVSISEEGRKDPERGVIEEKIGSALEGMGI